MAETVASLQAELGEAHARIADLEAALGLTNDNLGVTFKLSTQSNKLLGCLLATPNVTPEMITLRLGIATDAKVAIHRLREALKPHGLEVQSRRGLGYWLSDEHKARIKEITQEGNSVAPELVAA